ncbi:MAG: hypothetical protein K0R69_3345 [Clostridia bacterium]|jgi:hypothetical protein|nr:hypothetical protein [Clostridia bacterium]
MYSLYCIYNTVKGEDITHCGALLAGREAASFFEEDFIVATSRSLQASKVLLQLVIQ